MYFETEEPRAGASISALSIFPLFLTLFTGCIGVSTHFPDNLEVNYQDRPVDLIPKTGSKLLSLGDDRTPENYYGLGKPDDIEQVDEATQRWIYDEGWRWSGVVLHIIIPVPLLCPTGHNFRALTIKNHQLIEESYNFTADTLYGCGLFVTGPCTSGHCEFGKIKYSRPPFPLGTMIADLQN